MHKSLGRLLPDSPADYEWLAGEERLRYSRCNSCHAPFTEENVRTAAGWSETQISGYCENCWDWLFVDGEGSTL